MSIILLLATVALAAWVVGSLARTARGTSSRDGTADFTRAMRALAPRPGGAPRGRARRPRGGLR